MLTKKKCVRQLLCEHTKCMSGWRPAGLTRGSQRRGLCPRPVPGAGAGRDVPRDGGGGAACGAAADPPAGPLGAAPSPSPAGTASAGALPFSRSEPPPPLGVAMLPTGGGPSHTSRVHHAVATHTDPHLVWNGHAGHPPPPPARGQQLRVIEGRARAAPYLAGSEPTAADAALFPTAVFLNFILPRHFGWASAFDGVRGAEPPIKREGVSCEEGLPCHHLSAAATLTLQRHANQRLRMIVIKAFS